MVSYMTRILRNKEVDTVKKIISLLIALLICFIMLSGCAKIEDLSSTTKIEITKYSTTDDSDDIYSVTVDNDEQVKHICDNLNSLSMKKMGYNKPTEIEYTLTFYSSARKIQTISITAHGWIDYNGDFHNVVDGELDIDYIDSLLKDAIPSNENTTSNTSNAFEYSAGEKAVLTVLSTENLSKRYKDWDMNPAEYSTDEARVQELINILDRQTWAPLSSGNISVMQQDASLKLDRTLISEKDNGTPCDVGENANIVYFFDLEQGTVLMVYAVFNTDMWDRCCTLSEEDLSAVIEVFYYYRSMHIEKRR